MVKEAEFLGRKISIHSGCIPACTTWEDASEKFPEQLKEIGNSLDTKQILELFERMGVTDFSRRIAITLLGFTPMNNFIVWGVQIRKLGANL